MTTAFMVLGAEARNFNTEDDMSSFYSSVVLVVGGGGGDYVFQRIIGIRCVSHMAREGGYFRFGRFPS